MRVTVLHPPTSYKISLVTSACNYPRSRSPSEDESIAREIFTSYSKNYSNYVRRKTFGWHLFCILCKRVISNVNILQRWKVDLWVTDRRQFALFSCKWRIQCFLLSMQILYFQPRAGSWAQRAQRDTGPSVSATILCKSVWSMSCLQYFTFFYTLMGWLKYFIDFKIFLTKISHVLFAIYSVCHLQHTSRCKVKSTSTRGPIFCCWTLHIQVVILETGHNFRTSVAAGG